MIILKFKEELDKSMIDKSKFVNLTGKHKSVRVTNGPLNYLNSRIYTEPEHIDIYKINIDDFVSIAQECKFFLSGNHNHKRVTTWLPGFRESLSMDNNLLSKGDINIKSDVWIGEEATVLSGVTIGVGSIVAADAVVTKDVEPYSIVAGNPAKKVGQRFDDLTIKRLLDSKWWLRSIEYLEDRFELIFSEDINAFLESLKK